MSERVDEPVDQDMLLAFTTEPDGPKPSESDELLSERVDHLERALKGSASEIAALRAELATLVAATGDIADRTVPPVPPVSRRKSRAASFVVGALGIAAGILAIALWSRGSVDALASAPVASPPPMTIEQPSAPDTSPQPTIDPVIPAPAPEPPPVVRLRARADDAATDRVDYVGTLSIDAAPGGQVFIDRAPAGQTPMRAHNLKAGSHLVWIERDGYRRFTRVVQVPADRVSRVWADLEPIAR